MIYIRTLKLRWVFLVHFYGIVYNAVAIYKGVTDAQPHIWRVRLDGSFIIAFSEHCQNLGHFCKPIDSVQKLWYIDDSQVPRD